MRRRRLPEGYRLTPAADVPELLRADGSLLARFSAGGARLAEIVRAAREDRRGRR